MPKTTDKRTAARHAARVQRAHTTKQEGTVVRRRPAPRRRPARESSNIFAKYPVAFILLFFIILGATGYTLYAKQVWIFAPKPPVARTYPKLDPQYALHSPCLAVAQYLNSTTPVPDSANIKRTYSAAPPTIIDKNKLYCVGISTTKGFMLLELDPRLAPNTVNNFVYLADQHFYDGLTFHRVERVGQTDSDGTISKLALIQGGSPDGTPSGTPGYSFNDELNQKEGYVLGTVAMANSGANTNGSQFFIDTGNNSKVLTTHAYSLFGHLVKGIDTAININAGDKMIRVLTMAVPIPPTPKPTPTPAPTGTPTPALTPTPTPKK